MNAISFPAKSPRATAGDATTFHDGNSTRRCARSPSGMYVLMSPPTNVPLRLGEPTSNYDLLVFLPASMPLGGDREKKCLLYFVKKSFFEGLRSE